MSDIFLALVAAYFISSRAGCIISFGLAKLDSATISI